MIDIIEKDVEFNSGEKEFQLIINGEIIAFQTEKARSMYHLGMLRAIEEMEK